MSSLKVLILRQVYIDFPEEIKDQDAADDSSKYREYDIFGGMHMFLMEFDRWTDMTYLFLREGRKA